MTSSSEHAAASVDAPEPTASPNRIAKRFRGFLPVVVDVETGGFNAATDALLQVAAVTLELDENGLLRPKETVSYHVKPFEGANIEAASLQVNNIDPHHPLRPDIDEKEALTKVFKLVRREVSEQGCSRAVLVGHNAFFDLGFINACVARAKVKRNPFHPFSTFDTVTLAGALLGQTVLKRAVTAAGLDWDDAEAHSARYDTEKTAELFCYLINQLGDVYQNLVAQAAIMANDKQEEE